MIQEEHRRFWSGRRVAITGATGFLGSHLAQLLVACGAQVRALVRSTSNPFHLLAAGIRCYEADLHDEAALRNGCRGCDVVFHVAGAVDFHNDAASLYQVNVTGTQRLLAAARQAGVRRFVHTSSIVTVGASRRPQLLDEQARWNLGHLHIPYVISKRQAEEAALAANDRYLQVVVVNPSCVLGPDDFTGSEFGTLCRRFWQGRIPFYFGGGNNFVDVRDVAAGQLLAAQRGRPGQRYLLTGSNRSYGDFFGDLARMAGRSFIRLRLPNVCALGMATLEAWFRRASRKGRPCLSVAQARLVPWYFFFDAAKARGELGYAPRPIAQSLADAYRFWMQPRSHRVVALGIQPAEDAAWKRTRISGPANASASRAEPASSATIWSDNSSPWDVG